MGFPSKPHHGMVIGEIVNHYPPVPVAAAEKVEEEPRQKKVKKVKKAATTTTSSKDSKEDVHQHSLWLLGWMAWLCFGGTIVFLSVFIFPDMPSIKLHSLSFNNHTHTDHQLELEVELHIENHDPNHSNNFYYDVNVRAFQSGRLIGNVTVEPFHQDSQVVRKLLAPLPLDDHDSVVVVVDPEQHIPDFKLEIVGFIRSSDWLSTTASLRAVCNQLPWNRTFEFQSPNNMCQLDAAYFNLDPPYSYIVVVFLIFLCLWCNFNPLFWPL